MLNELVVWRGSILPSYQDELDEWLDDNDGDEDRTTVRCRKPDNKPLDVYGTGIDYPEMFIDTGGMFSDKRLVLIEPEVWKADTVKYVVQQFENMDCPVSLSMVYLTEDPPKYVEDRTTELRERYIVHYTPEDLAPWIQEWLLKRDVIVSADDALAAARHVGHDMDKLMYGLVSVANGFDGKISREILFSGLGKPGQVDIFAITRCMMEGDRRGAYEHLMRLDPETHPLQILGQISNRVSAIVAAHDPDIDLAQFKVYGGAQRYVYAEARNVTHLQGLRALEVIGRCDLGLKGGSTVSHWTQLELMVDTLCMIFNKQSMSSDGVHDDDIMDAL